MKAFFKSIAIYMRPYWLSVSFIFFAIAVQMSFKIALPMSFQLVFDKAIPQRDMDYFLWIFGTLCLWWLIQALLAVAQDIAAAKTGIAAINDLRSHMFQCLNCLPIDFFDQRPTGDLMARFSVDLVVLEKACIQSIYIFFFSTFNILASLALLFYIDWRLALLTFCGMVLSTILPKQFSGKAQQISYERQTEEGHLSATVQETLGSFEILHAFNLWRSTEHSFAKKLDRFKKKAIQAYSLSALVRRFGGQSAALLQVLILAFGSYLVIIGDMTVGTLVGFLALLQNMVGGTSHLAAVMPEMIQASGAMRRVEEYLADISAQDAEPNTQNLPRLDTSLRFDNVEFQYQTGKPVLQNLSFEIPKGKSVAIVGPSGSGKSTLLKLLLRFYEPGNGCIRWDSADIRHYSKASLRDQISIVPQDSVLFDQTLKENIRMGRLEASDAEVITAAEQAELDSVISHLPEGYDSQVGERGSHLSGGQRQRVAIARAILRNPALLILDEATSALDPLTEKAVSETLRRIAQDRTVISVTHRLSTAKLADQVLVMHGGEIVQQGHHTELIEAPGLYAKLWRKQTGFTISEDGFGAECSPHRLKLIPLFAKLSYERLKRISGLLVSEFFHRQRLVFKKGDPGDKFYIIVNGQVEINDIAGQEVSSESAILESGDFFGQLGVLDQSSRNASVATLLPTLFLTLNQYRFKKLLSEMPDLQHAIEDVARDRRRV